MEISTIINCMSSFSILEELVVIFIFFRFQSILKANSGDPEQMPRSMASYLGSHCLSMFPKKTIGLF